MSYEESNERKRSRTAFRTSLDIGMGLFYFVIGMLIMVYKAFGDMAIPPIFAYILGIMFVVGGGFRFYRGLKDILPRKREME